MDANTTDNSFLIFRLLVLSLNPMDKLLIDVENMNLRSDRRREEEIAAKKPTDVSSKVSIPGPNISKLKKDR